ncbi:MAG: hypothetical protein IPO75_06630 [Betaproteobacteria bacterium]|nr:hypothetical protein [Betaproteobacteria bacterium]
MKVRKARAHRPLPDFQLRLRLHRLEIARSLALDPTNEAAARELDAALEDLAYWFKRSWLFLRHADRNASIAVQRSILAGLVAKPIESVAALDKLDPDVFIRIGSHLGADGRQTGPFRLITGAASVEEVRRAVASALDGLGRVRRGRPPDTDSLALRQLAYGLAATWVSVTGSAPTRRVTLKGHHEYGPFRTFVATVLDAAPRQLRMTRKGAVRGIGFIVRLGVDSFRAGQSAANPAQPFGPLEDVRW